VRRQLDQPARRDRCRQRDDQNHGQKLTLRLIAKFAAKQNVTLLCHCAEDAKECHRFLLQALIERERGAEA
jgi:uncharacterized protein YeaO (DUF488 family)